MKKGLDTILDVIHVLQSMNATGKGRPTARRYPVFTVEDLAEVAEQCPPAGL